jgi:transcriptional regulator with XRE-family HTH domain
MQDAQTDLDRHFGDRLRNARRHLGLTPTELANRLGFSEIKVEQFENGRRRLAAGDLIEIARVLSLDVGYFFSDEDGIPAPSPAPGRRASSRESLDLLGAFGRIDSVAERRCILRLVETLGGDPRRRR